MIKQQLWKRLRNARWLIGLTQSIIFLTIFNGKRLEREKRIIIRLCLVGTADSTQLVNEEEIQVVDCITDCPISE
jgi:hypothetical protein